MSTIYKDKIVTQTLQLTNDSDQTVKLQSGGDNILICPSKLEITDTLIVNNLFLDGSGELEINELAAGGRITVDTINSGTIVVGDITKTLSSNIDLGDINLDNEKSNGICLGVKRNDQYVSHVLCPKGYLYIVCANHGGPHTGLIYLEPDRQKGKISASMIQGGWYEDDDADHYQIMAEPCNEDGGSISEHNWEDASYAGMRLYLNRITPSYNTGNGSKGGVKTETVNGNQNSQWWQVWRLPVKFNVSGFTNIKW